ncbi:MAG: molybdopterin-dependent oxidoreductase [Deltaproteobacteria bacterium]|jgi:DMSO/TMAO reductase YedYZ molybdopterin-dependent catalytic subunit|nr:molybdopterin-dependent oxidoreductase [Deltaproteobacteria bacterium]
MESQKKLTRREFMAAAGGTVVSIGLPGVFIKMMDSDHRAYAGELRPDGRPRVPPGQHAVKRIRDMGGTRPEGKPADWKLQIHGEVQKPMTLSLKDFMALQQVDLICDVHCVTGWTLLDSKWRGVRMQTLMDLVQVKDQAGFVLFDGPGNYSSNLPIAEARKENVILAHAFMDKKLPAAHGAPVRGLVPDRYFYKSVKWVKGIRFSVEDEPGYYESGGYSNSADPWKEERFD